MASLYLGVYRALYDYDARADEELSVHADDLLYLLERSDIDEWWKVKKRVLPVGDEEVDEPVGLIPSTYIEKVRLFAWHAVTPVEFHRLPPTQLLLTLLGGSSDYLPSIIRLRQADRGGALIQGGRAVQCVRFGRSRLVACG